MLPHTRLLTAVLLTVVVSTASSPGEIISGSVLAQGLLASLSQPGVAIFRRQESPEILDSSPPSSSKQGTLVTLHRDTLLTVLNQGSLSSETSLNEGSSTTLQNQGPLPSLPSLDQVLPSLSASHETLLSYQRPLTLVLPLPRHPLTYNPGPPPSPAPKAALITAPTLPPPVPMLSPVSSPAASEANFPSSQARTVPAGTVDQISAYSKPVDIPASQAAHFFKNNVKDGSYHFGYDTGSGQHQSYREEKRYPGGRVEGSYGYVDARGVLRIVEYTADQNGYRSKQTTHFLSNTSPLSFIGPIPSPLLARKTPTN